MADLNLNIKISKEDAALKELIETVSKLSSSLGGSTTEKVKQGYAEVAKAAKKASDEVVAAGEQRAAKLKQQEESIKKASENADKAAAASAQQYAKLKSEYEGRSLEDVRAKIMHFEEQTRTLRRARANEEDAATKKELQARTNAINTELQLYRSLEKEKIGRTFSEQMERLKLDQKSNSEIKKLLEHQAKEFKEIQEKMTITQNAEEKKRLSFELQNLKAENTAVKQEAEHRHIAPHEGGGEHKEGGGLSIGQIAGVGAAAEGLEMLVEKSREVAESQRQLAAGTGLSGEALKKAGEEAKELGDRLGVSGDEAKTTMGKVASYTHATGEELNKQTEAVIAYAKAHGKSAEMVAKKLSTASGQAEIFAEATENVAKVQKAAEDPAIRAQVAQQELEEVTGELANTLLTGLGPILKDIGPLIGEVGDILGSVLVPAMKIAQVILAPLIEGLKFLQPILPPLVIGIAAVTAAFHAQAIATGILNAVMAVNPFVWLGVAIVALIGIIVLLVKHWNEVVETLKKVWDAIANAGSAVLEFLGITSKAEAKTKEHTKAIKENEEALKNTKKTFEDVTKAANDYTDAIKKNREEAEKDAKEGQDNAIAALDDIDEKLADASKRAPGETAESLRQVRAQWVEHGKRMVKQQEDLEAEHHKHAVEIGAASDEDAKKKKDKTVHEAKDLYNALKQEEDNNYVKTKSENLARLLAHDLTRKQYREKELKDQIAHEEAINDIPNNPKFTEKQRTAIKKTHAGDILNATTTLNNDKLKLEEDAQNNELKQFDLGTTKLLEALEVRGVKENLTQGQIAKEAYKIKRQQLEERLKLEQSFGMETEATEKAIADLNRARLIEQSKQEIAIRKELAAAADAQVLTDMKSRLEKLKSLDGNHQKEIAEQETAISLEEEEQRYAKELEARKDDLANGEQGRLLKESLEANHQNKLTAIVQDGADKQRKIQQAQIEFMLGPFSQQAQKALDMIDKGVEHSMGLDQKKKTVFGQMANDVVSGYAKMGLSAIQHASISQIADAASASWKFVSAAASGVASVFATIPFPFDLIAAAGVVGGVAELATHAKAIKLAEGGLIPARPGGVHTIMAEAGHDELALPLNSGRTQDALGIKELGTKIDKSNALMQTQNDHLAAIRGSGQQRGPTSPSSMYNAQGEINRALNIAGRRVMK